MKMGKTMVLVILMCAGVVSCATMPSQEASPSSEGAQTTTVSPRVMASSGSSSPMVKLIEAFDHEHTYRGYLRERRYVIRVKNIAYTKQVFVHQKLTNGTWTNLYAQYKSPAGNGWETWELSLNSASDPIVSMIADAFVIGYTVSGQTYWDNNNGQNYFLAKNAGPLLGNGIMVAAVYLYSGGNGAIDVKNIAYAKDVTVVYTTNNWQSTMTATASYAGSRVYYGYSTFDNPNRYGVERWYFFLPSFSGRTVQYAVRYTVSGVTYWDNNEGANYTVR